MPVRKSSAASRTVCRVGARNVPLCRATLASARQAFAAAAVGKPRRIFCPSRCDQTNASKLPVQLQVAPSRERQERACLLRMPVGLAIVVFLSVKVGAGVKVGPALLDRREKAEFPRAANPVAHRWVGLGELVGKCLHDVAAPTFENLDGT